MPVMEIVSTAYGFVLGRTKHFFAIGWPLIGALAVLFTLQDMFDFGRAGFRIGQIIIEASFALLWHRYYLLGRRYARFSGFPKGAPKADHEAFGKVVQRFLVRSMGYSVGISLIIVVPALIIFFGLDLDFEGDAAFGVMALILAVVGAVLSPVLFRFFPYFPALAVGNMAMRFSDVWSLTRGKTLSIWLSFMLVFIPIIGLIAVSLMFSTAVQEWQGIPELSRVILANTIGATASIFGLAIGVTANSEIYRRLSGFEPVAITPEHLSEQGITS